jgi:hypothetical protein
MSRAICLLAGCGILLDLASTPCEADTVSFAVNCSTYNESSNQPGSLACADSLSSANAGVSATIGQIYVSTIATGEANASATYAATFQVLITKGVGSGSFLPCMMAGINDLGGMASGSFGSVSVVGDSMGVETCVKPPQAPPSAIPFEFGVPQTEQLSLMASAPSGSQVDSRGTGGFVTVGKFEVFDSSGNLLPSAQVSLMAVPEPSYLVALPLLLAAVCLLRPRRAATSTRL